MAFLAILILVPELFVALARLIVADEIDYLITQERTVLHDLFMLTNHLFSKCMLIGQFSVILTPTMYTFNSGKENERNLTWHFVLFC